jgi:hypothetical protein
MYANRTCDVVNMITKENVDVGEYWMASGYADLNDPSWVNVCSIVTTFVDAVVFISLPTLPGANSSDGFPLNPRFNSVVNSNQVCFDVQLYQANDSYCSKEWHVPEPVVSTRVSWMVVDKGGLEFIHRSTAASQDYLTSFSPTTAAHVTQATHPHYPLSTSLLHYDFDA